MKGKLLLSVVAFVCLAVFCSPLLAHHGNAAFAEKPIALKATVTKFSWANPHSLIEFDSKDDKGKVQHWVCETAAPQALKLIGWSKESLEPGDLITVYMYQAKTGNTAGRLNKIVLADGSELHDTQLGADGVSKGRFNNPEGETPGVK